MPSVPPVPLREQIGHALFLHEHSEVAHLRFAQGDIWDATEADERAPFLEAADKVLPLVEAAAEAERERVRSLGICPYGDAGCPCQDGDPCHYEGEDAIEPPPPVRGAFAEGQRYDERARLHSQLRSPEALERAIIAWGALENMTPTDRGWVDYHADIGELMRAAVEALLGVAATPPPATEYDHGNPFPTLCERCGVVASACPYPARLRESFADCQARCEAAATPQPEEPADGR